MPLAILVAAGGIALWSSKRQERQGEEVRQLVLAVCEDLNAGRDPMPRLQGTETIIARPLIARLAAAADRIGGRTGALAVTVEPGDTAEAGSGRRQATHTAVVRVDGAEVMRLRVIHRGRSRDIVIIGFWSPPPT
jgi:hypothetical protein